MTIDQGMNTLPPHAAVSATGDLPTLDSEPVAYAEAEPGQKQIIARLMHDIDISSSQSIMFFGSQAQQQLATITDSLLEGVRDNNLGSAGQSLSEIVTVLHSFDLDVLDQAPKPGFFKRLLARLFGRATPVARFIQQYERVRRQIDSITDKLERDKTNLLRHIATLDKLYMTNLEYFQELELYISAAQEQLRIIDADMLPELEQATGSTKTVVEDQALRDLRMGRNDLQRRIQDLTLTRMVSLQGIPGIRIVQQNDKQLVDKIDTTLLNTVSIWRQQLTEAVSIHRSMVEAGHAAGAIKQSQELLVQNNKKLHAAQSIRRANKELIASVEESLHIVTEGQQHHREAESTLMKLESELHSATGTAAATTISSRPG